MINANPYVPDKIPALEPLEGDLPDELDADTMLTVVGWRETTLAGFAAGVLVPLIPLVVLALAGVAATVAFNRGTIDFAAPSATSLERANTAFIVLLLVVFSSGILGIAMGLLRRWSVRHDITWRLLIGHYFSSHPGPHSVVALFVVPLLAVAILHGISVVGGYSLSFAPIFFLMIPPAWMLSGLMYEAAWETLILPILRSRAAEPMRWLAREAALFRLLKDDSYLLECRLREVHIDSATGLAQIRGDFPTPDHLRRAREVGFRVVGVTEVEIAG